MNQSWSIIIFGYNEEKTVASVIEKVCNFLNHNNIIESEIVVIDDGSNDNSQNIILDLKKKNKTLKYIRHKKNLGIGPALLSGYKNAKNENVIAIPADGQFDINELNPFINFPEKSFVSFYRVNLDDYTYYRKFVTLTNYFFNKYLLHFEIRDINWVKAYKTKDLREIDLKLESSLVGTEICAKLKSKGYKILESLSTYHKRTAGKAKGASLKTVSQAVKELAQIVIITRKFKKAIN